MPKPKGAMSSPYTGFAEEMKQSAMFDTVGTQQNVQPIQQEQQQAQVTQPETEITKEEEVTEEVEKFTSNELSKIITAITKVGRITSATPESVQVEFDGLKVKLTK